MAQEGWGPFEGPDVVDKHGIQNNLSKYNHILEDNKSGHDTEFDEEEEPLTLTPGQMEEAFTGKGKDEQAIKQFVRSYYLSPVKVERKNLMQHILCNINERDHSSVDMDSLYNDTLKTIFGNTGMPSKEPPLPACVDRNHTNSFYLTQYGHISVARVLCCLAYNSPDAQYCPLIYPITSVLRHYFSELDTFKAISILVGSRDPNYIPQTRMQYEVLWRTVFHLARKVCEKHLIFLQNESSPEEIDGLFQQCVWWVFDWLPFMHVVRVMDSFLIEGEKVLYRVCFAMVSIFTRHIKVKGSSWSGSIKKRGLQGAFIHFCKEIPVTPNSLLRKCFRYRNFSKASIIKLSVEVESELKSRKDGEYYLAEVSSLGNSDCRERREQ